MNQQDQNTQKEKKKKKITFFSDFKAFILRGNILDLAVAVIIGTAFGKIVTSLVNDIIMPLLSFALGGVSFSDLKWIIRHANEAEGITETALNYGNFIQATIDFLIIALCIFFAIRIIGKISRKLNDLSESVKQKIHTQTQNQPQVEVEPQDQTQDQAQTQDQKPTQEELLTQIRDLLKQQQS